ncbi:MAG: M10 family metallopeptidase C-terminal domain-containing protein [Paracoccaceae bacterium]
MLEFRVVETFLDAPVNMISGIGDLFVAQSNGADILYASTRAGGGVAVIGLSGAMTLVDQVYVAPGSELVAEPTLDIATFGNLPTLVVSGAATTTLLSYRVEAAGTLGKAIRPAGGPAGAITAQEFVQIDGQRFFYAALANSAAIQVYSIATDGTLSWRQTVQAGAPLQGVAIPELTEISVGASRFLAAVSLQADRLSLYRIDATGQLTEVAGLGAAQGLGIADPTGMRAVTAHGHSYLLVASASSSSLSLVEVDEAGTLIARDHLIDTLDTRLQGVRAFDAITTGGRSLVVAGGGDGGLNLLEILPDGRFVLVSELLDTPATGLENISAIRLRAVAGGVEVFVGSEGTGITRLAIDLTQLRSPVSGGAGADTLAGGTGADLIWGGDGNDVLRGEAGDDILAGGKGDDTLFGGAGADLFVMDSDAGCDTIADFQRGIDRIDLSAWGRVYDISALSFTATATGALLGFGGHQVQIVSSNGLAMARQDLGLAGLFDLWHALSVMQAVNGVWLGTPQDEFIQGTAGDDSFRISAGADTMDGDLGRDAVDFCDATEGVELDLHSGTGQRGWAATQVYRSIEDVLGSDQDDRLAGTAGANMLCGQAGDDTLLGRDGDDTLMGCAGNDRLIGGAGADWLQGGEGFDMAVYWDSAAGVAVNLGQNSGAGGEATGDRLTGIEAVFGSAHADVLTGDALANGLYGSAGNDRLYGMDGDDTLDGGEGDDTLSGGAGADLIIGGAGYDMVHYWEAAAPIRLDMADPAAGLGAAAGDRLQGIELVVATEFGDQILGDAAANILMGLGGDDLLIGRAGNDTLYGGIGNDTFDGGTGADMMLGAEGRDAVWYHDSAGAVWVDLQVGRGAWAWAQGDTMSSIEDLAGSAHADMLLGSAVGNRIEGLAGDDNIQGRDGDDTLYGGDGDDRLSGGAGADLLDGGAGFDMAFFWTASAGVGVDLANPALNRGEAVGDRYTSIECLAATNFDDHLAGDAADNSLLGFAGNDVLIGRDGNDTLLGGEGDDTLSGGAGADLLNGGPGRDLATYADAGSGIRVDLQAGRGTLGTALGDTLAGIEDLTATEFGDVILGSAVHNLLTGLAGNDQLEGRGGNDTLLGGAGDDRLSGGIGADLLDGGEGFDLAYYWAATSGVVVDLQNAGLNAGEAAGDLLVSIEAIYGSVHGDGLAGDAANNRLAGLDGNDSLAGRAGNDTLDGGTGDDTLAGGSGDDLLIGGAGADCFVFDGGRDTIADFSAAQDHILLDPALWGNDGRSLADILSTARLDAALSRATLEFGAADALFITGITDLQQLEAVIGLL